jgi:hypothetical protein
MWLYLPRLFHTLKYFYKLSVVNVSNQSDIELLFNGIVQTNFSYDATTKELFYQGFLVSGLNTLVVKATNQFGTDSKTINSIQSDFLDPEIAPTKRDKFIEFTGQLVVKFNDVSLNSLLRR